MAEVSHGFKIWGIDNVVYGPVDLPILVGWVKEERVQASTWVYSETADRWQKASEMPELQLFFKGEGAARQATASDTQLLSRAPGVKPGSLRRIKILAAFSDEQLTRFIQYMEVKDVRQFSSIVRQGDPGDAMFLILHGEVRVRMLIEGRESILTTLAAGDFFGEISLFDHGPRSADVVANEDSILLRISASAFQKVIENAPELAAPFLLAIGKTLTSRIRADNKRFRDILSFARSAMD